ncbi:MAG TPA: alpha/beta hydrolase [Candidatus Lumbricidophila sp.]|nr:alpha/beta hydrolase [Candidatus Lumbricidophila sp.]
MRARRRAAVGIVTVVTLALSGCTPWPFSVGASGGSHDAASSRGADQPHVAETVAPDLQQFYSQQLNWSRCGEMQCTNATAPLDWEHPGAGTISLQLVRHRATGNKLGSLFVNPGGPGGSGADFVENSLNYAVGDALVRQFDVIGFDPRGVGRSTAVKCLDDEAMTKYLYDIVPGAIGSDEWIAAQTKAQTAFGEACVKNTGPLIEHVDTVSAARDLDLLRSIVGDQKLNYLGFSYGTFLGATYAGLFPAKVGRLVLDGALDPAADGLDHSITQAVGFESAMRSYLTKCLKGKGCPFSGSPDDGMKQVGALLDAVAASPLRGDDGREVGYSTLSTAIAYPLYSPQAWDQLTAMFKDVKSGSAELALQLADAYNDRSATGHYSTNLIPAFIAISCADDSGSTDVATMRREAATINEAAPYLGPGFGYAGLWCSGMPAAKGKPAPISADGADPILVIGTTNDPATPYKWAQALAKQLSSGVLVTYNGEGHTAYNKSNSCVDRTVENYFINGTVPKSDPNC